MVVKFIHADHLRLGTPISGLADSPAWLKQLATASVRQAVGNLIENTVAHNAAFLLIAGSVCNHADDLEAVSFWLKEQFRALQKRGIRIVGRAETVQQQEALQSFCDFVIRDFQALSVTQNTDGHLRISVIDSDSRPTDGLCVSTNERVNSGGAILHYRAIPASRSQLKPDSRSHYHPADYETTASAGAVQAVHHDENHPCGVIAVEADLSSRTIQTQFIATDVLRYSTERLTIGNVNSQNDLISSIVAATSSMQRISQTNIVDIVVSTQLTLDGDEATTLQPAVLLQAIRERLHGGHRGLWPRSVRFSDDSSISLSPSAPSLLNQFSTLTSQIRRGQQLVAFSTDPKPPPVVTQELMTGLNLLRRVA